MGVSSEVPLDPNLALTRHVGPMDHPSSPGHLESSFSGAGENHHDLANRFHSSFPDGYEASSSGYGLNFSMEPGSLLQFFVR